MRLPRSHLDVFIESSGLVAILPSLVRHVRSSASHRLGSDAVARALDLRLSNVACVLGSCVLGESLSVAARVLLVHCCEVRPPESREFLVVPLVVSVCSVEFLLDSLLPGEVIGSVAHFILLISKNNCLREVE